MPRLQDIKVYPIAETSMNPGVVENWLEDLGVDRENVRQMFGCFDMEDGEKVIGVAAKRCYMSFQPGLNPNVNKIRKDWTEYFNNILKSGHGSVLEHATYTFAIEGVTRVFTGEMNRHRAGVAISEGSMRYISFKEIPYWLPESIKQNVGGDENAEKKQRTREIFDQVFSYVEAAYKELCYTWDLDALPFAEKKKLTSMFRRIIPMGVSTGGIWTLNVRALRHILALRSSPHAEEEIALVMSKIAKHVVQFSDLAFGDFDQVESGAWVPKYPKV